MSRYLPFLILFFVTNVWAQVPSYVPQSGLRCYYPFSGNSNDASAAASHLVNNGAVLTTDRFGNSNSAYSFDGISQSMSTNTPNFTFGSTSSFTVSIWIQKSSTASGVALMSGSPAAGNFIWLLQGGSTMTYGTNKQQQPWIFIPSPVTIGNWEHFVCVYSNGTMTFYRNNVIESTGTFTHTNVSSANLPFYVGKEITSVFFAGKLDDIGIWDRALTACEISDLFNATSTITTVAGGPDVTLCAGQSTTLNGVGASNLVWSPSVVNGSSFVPPVTQTYTLTGTDGNGCSAWDQVTVTVNQPLINAGVNQTICLGTSITLTATGTSSPSWNNGVVNGVPFVPTSSQTYTVTGIDFNGCPGSDQVLINTYQPNINAGNDVTVCAGSPVTLTATGGVTYSWNNSVVNNVSFVPQSSQTYVVVGTNGVGCSKSDTVQVFVNPLPNISAGADLAACVGESVTLSGSGGTSYVWSNGVINGQSFSPTVSGTYVVVGSDVNNCSSSDTVFVTVNSPSFSTLSITAIDSYNLNGTVYNSSGTYTQVITNADGCDSTITLNLFLDFTSLEETTQTIFQVYPNPVDQMINVRLEEQYIGSKLQFFNVDGSLVKEVICLTLEYKVDVSDLESGVYFCSMKDIEGAKIKIIKH